MYYYTGILPKGIKETPGNKYTGPQLRYIGAALFSDLNGKPTEVVADELGADYVDGRRKKRRSPSKRRRSKSKKMRSKSKKRSKRSKRSKKRSKRRSM